MSNPFQILNTDNLARTAVFTCEHGSFETPAFMPVGTKATVKGVDCERLKETGAQITLVNTYHLWLQSGADLIESMGGIHKFCGWKGPILSDSGGFQVFSLQEMRKITEEGVKFRSHLDNSKIFLSPEIALDIQAKLGVDIAMVLDECPSSKLEYKYIEKSLELTLRWAKRSLDYAKSKNLKQNIFAITQGGLHADLRKKSAEALAEMDFPGYAIGGLSVGEGQSSMYEVLDYHPQQLPENKIRYLMGVGTPKDIVYAISKGIDLFDCVIPTRSGRFGRAYISGEEPYINIVNSEHKFSEKPVDSNCNCVCCRNYSRAYLRFLFKNSEMLGPQLLSIHNLTFYQDLIHNARLAITEKRFTTFFDAEMSRWNNIKVKSANQEQLQ